jgi:hypothetical protein
MVDLFVGLSTVTLIWQASGTFLIQFLLAALYAAWLLILKPRSNRSMMALQGGVSQFLSLTAVFSIAHYLDSSIVVLACALIGYVTARHVLGSYEEDDQTLLSAVWGFFIAELGWLSYHWVVAYEIKQTLLQPPVANIAGLFSFVVARFYDAKYHEKNIGKAVRAPMLFSLSVLAILLLRELSVIFNYTS